MKRICFYVDSIYTLGGIQRVVTTLCNELCESYDITIVCQKKVKDKDKVNYDLKEDINVIVIDNNYYYIDKIVFFPIRVARFLINKLKIKNKLTDKILRFDYKIFKRKRLIKFFNESKFEYILSEGLKNNIYLSRIKNSIKSTIIGCWHSNYDNYINSGYSIEEIKDSIQLLDKTIVLSKYDVDMIYKRFGLNVDYIYNFITSVDVKKSTANSNVFLSVGRYDKIKGYDRLIKVFKRFCEYNNSWKLLIVGEGSERKKLEQLIKKLDLEKHVILTGKTNCVDDYYNEASIYLMSSYGEGFPMVIVEAMKHSLPVIAYSIPVLFEILPNDDNIIEQDDDEEYLKRMIELSSNLSLIKRYGNANLNKSKEFYEDKIIEQWKKILN